ncbi:hypothetical protein F5984_24405 [Rudanella paleaurantiibacter]|uniref:Periplasmic heavy metal sensor n=1 Tax=Rudanella paleaurantiibacter TaxID=2614655 RepID=A0A7J5TSJ8_9BACT|nr:MULTISPECIES: hypothetical protein [Rudanella]KAB7726465.1 hypothetical protein F5984_24405 [Rudanella paleaurantiibacter]
MVSLFIRLSLPIWLSVTGFNVVAQHNAHTSPYQAEAGRTIKTLSEADISGYLNGRGMGLAKAAELNGYPGPMHVLELEKELALTATQKAQMQMAYNVMHERAVVLGKQIVEQETALNRLFSANEATPEAVQTTVEKLAQLQGQLRLTHLDAHLKAKQILAVEQVNQYNRLRGYTK